MAQFVVLQDGAWDARLIAAKDVTELAADSDGGTNIRLGAESVYVCEGEREVVRRLLAEIGDDDPIGQWLREALEELSGSPPLPRS